MTSKAPTLTMRDEQAELISQLMAGHQQRLSGYIRALVPTRDDAEDVLQEVNLFIWRHGQEFQRGTNFTAWAYQIARFHVLNFRKRRRAGSIHFSDAVMEQMAVSAATSADFAASRLQALEQCMEKLSDKDRALVGLRYREGATTQSVAEQIGRSVKGVYHSLNRIRASLLECIQRNLAREARP